MLTPHELQILTGVQCEDAADVARIMKVIHIVEPMAYQRGFDSGFAKGTTEGFGQGERSEREFPRKEGS